MSAPENLAAMVHRVRRASRPPVVAASLPGHVDDPFEEEHSVNATTQTITMRESVSDVVGETVDFVADASSTAPYSTEAMVVKMLLGAVMTPMDRSWQFTVQKICCRMLESYITHHVLLWLAGHCPTTIAQALHLGI